jgi:hypothetical protein
MRRPLLAFGLVFLASIALSAGPTLTPGKPASRWAIKTSVVNSKLAHPKKIDYGVLASMDALNLTAAEKKSFRDKRLPNDMSGFHEGDIVRVTGYLQVVAQEADGDFHVQLTSKKTGATECIVVEIPNPDKAFVADEKLRGLVQTPRDFIVTRLLKSKQPGSGGNVMIHPPYVTVTGQLFYDGFHQGEKRGTHHMTASSLWELHPVTKIAFAPLP